MAKGEQPVRMNALTILGQQQQIDPVGSFYRGAQVREQMDEYGRQRELRNALAQNGAGLLSGDQNALAAIAQYDPAMAFQFQRGHAEERRADAGERRADATLDLNRRNTDSAIADRQARLKMMEDEAARQIAAASDQDRMNTLDTLGKLLPEAEKLQTPEEWDKFFQQADPSAVGQFENRDSMFAVARGLMRGASGGELGLTPVWGTDAQGNPALVQLSKDGTVHQPQMPDGFTPGKDPIRIDMGTGTGIMDPQTRQIVGVVPKDVAGEAREGQLGKNVADQIASAPKAVQQADMMLSAIDGVIADPNLPKAVGWGSYVPFDIPGFNAETRGRLNQLEGQAFLQAFESLKGGGAITEVEGQKATQAIARLNRAQNAEEFTGALTELRDVVLTARDRSARRLSPPAEAGAPAADDGELFRRYGIQP